MVVEKQTLAGPGGVGGGGFEGELGLGDGEALGSLEFAGARAVGCEVFGFSENGFKGFLAGVWIKAPVSWKSEVSLPIW
jgi:hypothetical protein